MMVVEGIPTRAKEKRGRDRGDGRKATYIVAFIPAALLIGFTIFLLAQPPQPINPAILTRADSWRSSRLRLRKSLPGPLR